MDFDLRERDWISVLSKSNSTSMEESSFWMRMGYYVIWLLSRVTTIEVGSVSGRRKGGRLSLLPSAHYTT